MSFQLIDLKVENAIAVYTSELDHSAGGADPEILLQDRLTRGREQLDNALEALTIETHETGLRLAERYGLSTYDAMIIGSALQASCDVLWSEDLQHGMKVENLRILDPFRR